MGIAGTPSNQLSAFIIPESNVTNYTSKIKIPLLTIIGARSLCKQMQSQ